MELQVQQRPLGLSPSLSIDSGCGVFHFEEYDQRENGQKRASIKLKERSETNKAVSKQSWLPAILNGK